MNENKSKQIKQLEQEHLCLATKQTIDLLITQLLQNESFPDYAIWNKRLKKLKLQINDIYWEL